MLVNTMVYNRWCICIVWEWGIGAERRLRWRRRAKRSSSRLVLNESHNINCITVLCLYNLLFSFFFCNFWNIIQHVTYGSINASKQRTSSFRKIESHCSWRWRGRRREKIARLELSINTSKDFSGSEPESASDDSDAPKKKKRSSYIDSERLLIKKFCWTLTFKLN